MDLVSDSLNSLIKILDDAVKANKIKNYSLRTHSRINLDSNGNGICVFTMEYINLIIVHNNVSKNKTHRTVTADGAGISLLQHSIPHIIQ